MEKVKRALQKKRISKRAISLLKKKKFKIISHYETPRPQEVSVHLEEKLKSERWTIPHLGENVENLGLLCTSECINWYSIYILKLNK